jgi:putative membrane protein
MSAETPQERTALAWQRTGLGMAAVAGLVAHSAVRSSQPGLLVLAGVAALLGLGVLGGLAPVRYRQIRRRLETGDDLSAPRLVALVTGAIVLVAAAGVAAILTAR